MYTRIDMYTRIYMYIRVCYTAPEYTTRTHGVCVHPHHDTHTHGFPSRVGSIYVCLNICVFVCVCARACTCVHVRVYICIYVSIYTHILCMTLHHDTRTHGFPSRVRSIHVYPNTYICVTVYVWVLFIPDSRQELMCVCASRVCMSIHIQSKCVFLNTYICGIATCMPIASRVYESGVCVCVCVYSCTSIYWYTHTYTISRIHILRYSYIDYKCVPQYMQMRHCVRVCMSLYIRYIDCIYRL